MFVFNNITPGIKSEEVFETPRECIAVRTMPVGIAMPLTNSKTGNQIPYHHAWGFINPYGQPSLMVTLLALIDM